MIYDVHEIYIIKYFHIHKSRLGKSNKVWRKEKKNKNSETNVNLTWWRKVEKKEIEGLFSLLIYRWALTRASWILHQNTYLRVLAMGHVGILLIRLLGQPHVMDYKGANQSNVKKASPIWIRSNFSYTML